MKLTRLMTVLIMLMVLGLGAVQSAQSATYDVSGNTYTSPTYGYSVTWPTSWWLVEESVDPAQGDLLGLMDGTSFAIISGSPSSETDPRLLVGDMMIWAAQSPDFENVLPVTSPANDSEDWNAQHATMTISYTIVRQDGVTMDQMMRVDIRTFGAELVVTAILSVPAESYPGYEAIWDELLAGIAPPPGLEGESSTTAPDAEPVLAVNDPWTLAITGGWTGDANPDLGLATKEGSEWIVLVADLTNESGAPATLDLRDVQVKTTEMVEPISMAASSTRQVARELELTAQGNFDVEVAPGATEQVVLVYAIPAGGSEPVLVFGTAEIPLAEVLTAGIEAV